MKARPPASGSPRKKQKSEETALSKAIQTALTLKGARCIRIQSGIIPALYGKTKRYIHCAKSGTPDLLVILPMLARSRLTSAELTFLEVKKKGGKQSPEQLAWSAWAELNGVRSFVVRGVSEAVSAVFRSEV